MSGEHFDGEDVGYVPENMEFPQIHSDEHDEGDVIDDSGFPQLHQDDESGFPQLLHDDESGFPQLQQDDESGYPQLQHDDIDDEQVGSLGEDANLPEDQLEGHDVENFPEIDDAIANALTEQHTNEEQHDEGNHVTENFGSPEKKVPGEDSKGIEIKKWYGWPGENVFRMLVPAQKVGSIIGRKGEFIKKITEETRARVKILDGPQGTAERAVVSKYE